MKPVLRPALALCLAALPCTGLAQETPQLPDDGGAAVIRVLPEAVTPAGSAVEIDLTQHFRIYQQGQTDTYPRAVLTLTAPLPQRAETVTETGLAALGQPVLERAFTGTQDWTRTQTVYTPLDSAQASYATDAESPFGTQGAYAFERITYAIPVRFDPFYLQPIANIDDAVLPSERVLALLLTQLDNAGYRSTLIDTLSTDEDGFLLGRGLLAGERVLSDFDVPADPELPGEAERFEGFAPVQTLTFSGGALFTAQLFEDFPTEDAVANEALSFGMFLSALSFPQAAFETTFGVNAEDNPELDRLFSGANRYLQRLGSLDAQASVTAGAPAQKVDTQALLDDLLATPTYDLSLFFGNFFASIPLFHPTPLRTDGTWLAADFLTLDLDPASLDLGGAPLDPATFTFPEPEWVNEPTTEEGEDPPVPSVIVALDPDTERVSVSRRTETAQFVQDAAPDGPYTIVLPDETAPEGFTDPTAVELTPVTGFSEERYRFATTQAPPEAEEGEVQEPDLRTSFFATTFVLPDAEGRVRGLIAASSLDTGFPLWRMPAQDRVLDQQATALEALYGPFAIPQSLAGGTFSAADAEAYYSAWLGAFRHQNFDDARLIPDPPFNLQDFAQRDVLIVRAEETVLEPADAATADPFLPYWMVVRDASSPNRLTLEYEDEQTFGGRTLITTWIGVEAYRAARTQAENTQAPVEVELTWGVLMRRLGRTLPEGDVDEAQADASNGVYFRALAQMLDPVVEARWWRYLPRQPLGTDQSRYVELQPAGDGDPGEGSESN